MIVIQSNGADIVATNYWASPLAAAGLFLLSTNAGEPRLLVPRSQHLHLTNLTAGVEHVLLSYGLWTAPWVHGAEWLAEDNTVSPFALQLQEEVMDQKIYVPPGKVVQTTASIWIESGGRPQCYRRMKAYIRQVDTIPCLQAVEISPANLIVRSARDGGASAA
jgi:hypothetical protein